MRLNAIIAGAGMTRFMKYPDKGLKQLGSEAVHAAVANAGLTLGDIEAAYVGNGDDSRALMMKRMENRKPETEKEKLDNAERRQAAIAGFPFLISCSPFSILLWVPTVHARTQ